MANKYSAVALWCFLCMSRLLFAQTQADKHYYIREDEEGTVLYQQLSWEAVEDILGYKFELEQKNGEDEWIVLEKKTLQENFTDVSLSPGSYRFRVSVINLLEQTEALSDYQNFSILLARQPEVYELSPDVMYLDKSLGLKFTAEGKNFVSGTEFTLEKDATAVIELTPLEIDESGRRAVFTLNMSTVSPGEYIFCARDKSGLYDNSRHIELKFQKPLDVYLSAGYAFTGFAGSSAFKEYYQRDFAPMGAIMRFTVIPLKRSYGHFGFNLGFSAFSMEKKLNRYKISGFVMMPHIGASYVYPLIKDRLNLDVHLGTGAVFLMNSRFVFTKTDFKSPVYWYWGMSVNGGTAFRFYVRKKLYAELNIEHIAALRQGFPKYMCQPQLAIGWEF